MSIALITGAGLAIVAAVGPAREWRGALASPQTAVEPVDRSEIVKREGGVPGSVVLHPPGQEVILEKVPIGEQLLKKPDSVPVVPKSIPVVVRRPPVVRRAGPAIPIAVVTAPKEPQKKLAIPTNSSPVPASNTQMADQPQIKNSGPTESAPPQRSEVVVAKGADGWNKVEVTKTGFAPANPERAAAIDKQRAAQEAALKGVPHVTAYVGLDLRDPDTSMTPTKTKTTMQVHDSQMHLFETAATTQQRLAAARTDMSNGDTSSMQALFREIADSSAANQKMRVRRVSRACGIAGSNGATTVEQADPSLVRDEQAEIAADELNKLSGVDRCRELVSRGEADKAFAYLGEYLVQNESDGRAHAVLGLHRLTLKENEAGLKNLARACALGASAFSEPIDLSQFEVSPAAVADSIGRLLARKEQAKGIPEALGLAAASNLIGRADAAKRLLDQAVSLGMDRTDAANLIGLWKIGL